MDLFAKSTGFSFRWMLSFQNGGKPSVFLISLLQVWSMDGYYKGRRVLEYRTMGDFTKGQNFVQHLLPHPWAGTGHVVYNGSLYYNKHQSNILVGDRLQWK